MKRILRIFAIGFGVFLLVLLMSAGAISSSGFFDPPDISKLDDPRETSQIFDERGVLIKEYCTYCREIIPLKDMGVFPQVAVALEDKHFWSRWGPIDWVGVTRAFWENVKAGRIEQGASTITQQVARNIFAEEELRRERETGKLSAKLWRKTREAYIAAALEKTLYDKLGDRKLARAKILELYLNTVYCGDGRYGAWYGVKACSRWYFNKLPSELNYAEAAMIAGLWRMPNASPFLKPNEALALRSRALQQLVNEGVVSVEQKKEFEKIALPQRRDDSEINPAPHFAEFVRRKIVEKHKFVDQGLKTYTTLNLEFQKVAQKSLRAAMDAMTKRNPELAEDLRGTALVVDVRTGAIKVFAQEPSFKDSEYLLYQIRRHTGSAFKPFFYVAWLMNGGRLSCEDEGSGPCKLDDSTDRGDGKSLLAIPMGRAGARKYIQNFPYIGLPRYRGIIPAILALTESRNAATMSGVVGVRNSRASARISKEEILEAANKLGVSPPGVDPGLTIAIGSIDVSLYEMVRAWTAMMNGRMIEPYAVEELTDAKGKVIESAELRELENIFQKVFEERLEQKYRLQTAKDPKAELTHEEKEKIKELSLEEALGISFAITRGMRATVELPHGTGSRAKKELLPLGIQVMGKTGTATDAEGETTDNWFIGCTPSYCMGIWIGRDKKLPIKTMIIDGQPMQETGGRNALPVFIETMKKIYETEPKDSFPEVTDPKRPFRFKAKETAPMPEAENGIVADGNDF